MRLPLIVSKSLPASLLVVLSLWTVAPTSHAAVPKLKVLTQNLWGLPAPLSKEPERRIRSFCMFLQNQNPRHRYDVILLQEVWKSWMADILKDCGYRHVLRLDEANYETGLMILSDHPVSDGYRKMFDHKPAGWDAFKTGESISSKGILTGVIHHPHFGDLQVADIHVVANYGGDMKFEDFRRLQLQEASQILRDRASGLPVIIGGDFNVAPDGNSHTPLWEEIAEIFYGFERFIPKRPVSTRSSANPYSDEDEGQLDHIFASNELKAIRGAVTSDTPGMIFSDHFGWETTFVKAEEVPGRSQ